MPRRLFPPEQGGARSGELPLKLLTMNTTDRESIGYKQQLPLRSYLSFVTDRSILLKRLMKTKIRFRLAYT